MASKFEILKNEIILRSEAKEWNEAKEEWDLYRIFYNPNDTCLCTHSPITKLCQIRNKKNGILTIVGRCCVKNFLEIDTETEFRTLEQITSDPIHILSTQTINKLVKKGIIPNRTANSYYLSARAIKNAKKQKYTQPAQWDIDAILKINKIIKWKLTGHNPVQKIISDLKNSINSELLKPEEVEFVLFLDDTPGKLQHNELNRIRTLAKKLEIKAE